VLTRAAHCAIRRRRRGVCQCASRLTRHIYISDPFSALHSPQIECADALGAFRPARPSRDRKCHLLCAMSGLSFTGIKSQRCGYPSRLCFFALHPKAEPPIRRAWKKQRLELQVSRLGDLRVLVIREADFPRNQKLPCRKTAQRSAPVPLTVRAGPTLAVCTWCCDNALPLES
jgi:hypothetical protein